MPNLINSQEPEPVFFWPLGAGAGAARKILPGAGAVFTV